MAYVKKSVDLRRRDDNPLRKSAYALYQVGVPIPQIGIRLNIKRSTLESWIQRLGWRIEKNKRIENAATIVETVHSHNLSTALAEHQASVQRVVASQIDSLAAMEPLKPKNLSEAVLALKTLDDVGRRNLGLNDSESGTQRTTFNFNLSKMPTPKKIEERVIDINPVLPPDGRE